jgi:hypothetical protein
VDPVDDRPEEDAHDVEDVGEPGGLDDEGSDGFDDEEVDEDGTPRRNALPRRIESWRARSMTGAVMSAMAMGLQQVFASEGSGS